MTFTYAPSATPNDTTRVRFHLGDTVESVAIFTDEEIAMMIAEEGTWQKATVACIKSILGRVASEPDIKADWLSVDYGRSAQGWYTLLKTKQAEFGLGRVTATAYPVYRADSYQSSDFDYTVDSDDDDE